MNDVFNWLRLARSENVTNIIFWKLLQQYHTIEKALEALPYLARNGGRRQPLKIAEKELIEAELEEAAKHGVEYLHANHSSYPKILKHIDYPPPVISILGNKNCLQKPSVAIVGSRKASNSGLQLAASFARQLGLANFVIVSGLAKGIDTAAHKASVITGTIAVLAGGVNYIYPYENRRLYYEILDNGGAIISEKPFAYEPVARDFPKRNRIIAGLSLAMLVVEATKRSGSLISARLANDLNKIVFALPQSLLNEQGQGNNELLRAGATIALTPNDIIETLLPLSIHATAEKQPSLFTAPEVNYTIKEPDYSQLLEPPRYNATIDLTTENIEITEKTRETIRKHINYTPISLHSLQKFSNISLKEIECGLLELQLAGKITRDANNNIALKY